MNLCKNCNKEIQEKRKYCNNLCQATFENKQRVIEWLKGKNFLKGEGLTIPVWMREFLLKEADYKCSECEWSKINIYTQKVPLEIDHIDGDAKNNLKHNLRVLCANCHSLTKTFKNIGGRKSSRTNRKK